MRTIILFLTICLAMLLVASTPIDKEKQLVNRPKIDVFGSRKQRSSPAGVKGHQGPLRPIDLQVRKGEYVCGNRICKLAPGVEPKGCNGLCQYPVK